MEVVIGRLLVDPLVVVEGGVEKSDGLLAGGDADGLLLDVVELDEVVEVRAVVVTVVVAVVELARLVCLLSLAPLVLIRSEIIVLLFTSQLLGEVGGEVEVGEADADDELATELQLPVFLDRSVGSFSLAAADA